MSLSTEILMIHLIATMTTHGQQWYPALLTLLSYGFCNSEMLILNIVETKSMFNRVAGAC